MDIMSSNAKRTLLDGEIEVILPGRKVSEKVHFVGAKNDYKTIASTIGTFR